MKLLEKRGARVHFIGVGGVGVGGVCLLADSLGYSVSGSDRSTGELFSVLRGMGFQITVGHKAENVIGKDLVVYSLAVSEENPELLLARRMGIPAISRAEFLGILMQSYGERIGVSGAHGKSTTTAMIDAIYNEADMPHTTLVGATLDNGLPIRISGKDTLIYEACEYKDSFLHFDPTAAVFTSLELDHVDYFKDIDAIKSSYLAAMNKSPIAVINGDDINLMDIAKASDARIATYGEGESCDYKIATKLDTGGCFWLDISKKERKIMSSRLSVAGEFNARNGAAAAVMAIEMGVSPELCAAALSHFHPVGRRLEEIGTVGTARIFYDYAHHPTEIRASIGAVRDMGYGRVGVIFKPHTYSRTSAFINEFASALSLADRCILLEIDGIREENVLGVTSSMLSSMINGAVCLSDSSVTPGHLPTCDAVILMGAADMSTLKARFLKEQEIAKN